MPKLTHERLLQVLGYEPSTGVFTWKVRMSNSIHEGDRAGIIRSNGRRMITISGELHQAHRLAWFYTHGVWPVGDIRQKNGNYDDCSIDNLYEISRIEAARQRGMVSNNTSGHKGVSPAPKGGWKASVTCNYKQINLGIFHDKEVAIQMVVHANGLMAGAVTPAECDAATNRIIQYRRKRVAWERLNRTARRHTWVSFEVFCADVGVMDQEESTIAAIDEGQPIGPGNFRWLNRPQGTFDRASKEGRAAYMRAYREANPDRWRHAHLKKNYGIDEIDFAQMAHAQGGKCLICEESPTEERLAVDHCHNTDKKRGLLCKQCNYAMGQFGDNAEKIRRAADFLDGLLAPVLQETAGHG